MRVSFIQTRPLFGEVEKNVEKAVSFIRALDADLVVLPELFSTGYQFRSREEVSKLSEPVPGGYSTGRLMEVAAEKKMHIVFGIAERGGRAFYNSSVLLGPKGVVGLYRKAHLFRNEKKFFSPGNIPLGVHSIGKARVGMMVCFDWLFPEVARTLALKGADIICHPSNLVLPYCPDAMITRCLENRVFAITANRVGTEHRIKGQPLKFIGTSRIISPDGRVLLSAGKREEAGIVEINPRKARNKKITPENDIFKDRRKDLFRL